MSNPEGLSFNTSEIKVLTLMNVMVIAMEKRAKWHRDEMTPINEVALKNDAFGDTVLNGLIFSEEDHAELDMIEDRLMRQYLMND